MRTVLAWCVALLLMPAVMTGGESLDTRTFVQLPVKNDPTISFRLWFKVGSQNDPKGKEGLAFITGEMISDASTKNNVYATIIDRLYPLAASYSASVSAEMSVMSGRVHKDNLAAYYPLFMDAVLVPAFAQDDLDRIKSQALSLLETTLRFASDEELGKAMLYNDLYAGSPYGHIVSGTVEGVKSITLDDVKSFYRTYYTRDNVVPGIGGGYDKELIEKIASDLGKLPAGIPAPVPVSAPVALDGFHVTIVDKDAPATAISMGFPMNLQIGRASCRERV
jgi:zinc protease